MAEVAGAPLSADERAAFRAMCSAAPDALLASFRRVIDAGSWRLGAIEVFNEVAAERGLPPIDGGGSDG